MVSMSPASIVKTGVTDGLPHMDHLVHRE